MNSTRQHCAAIARRLAQQNSEGLMLCPDCGAEVKAENLDRHLSKVHSLEPTAGGVKTAVVSGSDRRMQFVTFVPMLCLFAAFYPVTLAPPESTQLVLGIWTALFVLLSLPIIAAFMDKFPATLEVTATGVRMRWLFGLISSEATLPIRIETGSMKERKESNMVKDGYGYRGTTSVVQVGTYFGMIGANGKKVVVGAAKSTHPLRFWEMEHVQGGPRRRWDVQLDTAELVRLQYLLAEHGALRRKTA